MSFALSHLLRKKSIAASPTENSHLNKNLTVLDLSLMGVAAIIGAGIFSTIGKAAFDGGTGIFLLIIFICITCLFCALCYAEFASRVPNAGSAYSYIYATLGEFPAWVIGWALILEYSFSNSVLAIAWGSYFQNLLDGLNIHLPVWLTSNYFNATAAVYEDAPHLFGLPLIINLPPFAFNVLLTWVAYIGIKEAKWTSHITVTIKLITIAFVIVIGFFYVEPQHWRPLFPYGMKGVMAGTAAIFFAFFGFDSISTMAEECKNPQRDLPRSMFISLIFCAFVYVLITFIITGIVGYENLNVSDPIAYIFEYMNFKNISYIISVSALFVITSAFIVFQIAQPRVWLSMGRDGLLPQRFARIHPRHKTPAFGTIITGLMVGIPALFLDMSVVTDLSSIGTLFAFILVCGGVLVLPPLSAAQRTSKMFQIPYINSKYIVPLGVLIMFFIFHKDISERLFSTPSLHILPYIIFLIGSVVMAFLSFQKSLSLIPVLGILCCLFLVTELGLSNWVMFSIWLLIGLFVYFTFGYKNSALHQPNIT